ncbi:MAG: glycosyltransferase family 2 protein [Lentimicrobiaceae bacterium]|nr:glycosyltransferase family 2 protein [Lentimicrobiaceae bacterium]
MHMKLSIVVVNYNVVYFLEQCLSSVYQAVKGIDAEVFVADNNSVDGSVEMLQEKFPQVKLIANKENLGFSKANNQAIRQAKGEYILLLNPDTVVEMDTFSKIIAFMDETADAGALGVKMVNGRGDFLPESKRSLPVPSVAFYKIFGLSKLFKKSHRFGKYHLTYLDADEIHSVEVLSGAFMLLRKSVLDKIGLLDEDYFMYGEDIDLSYRIIKSGYKNYYFPQTRIIHYKGESTRKSSINYVFVFYRAMQIFAKKHFSQKNAALFNLLINSAIWLRAGLSIAKRLFFKIVVPLLDYALIYAGILAIANYWEYTVLQPRASSFADIFLFAVLPIYVLIWTISIYLSGAYKKPISYHKLNQGIIGGTIFILIIYSMLGEDYRFSRAIIVFGAVWTFFATNLLRYFIQKLKLKSYPVGGRHSSRILIVGDKQETDRVASLLNMTTVRRDFLGFVNCDSTAGKDVHFIGSISQLKNIIAIYQVGEVIFCSKNLSAKEIISLMADLQDTNLEYKIAPPESSYIIGSNSIDISGDIHILDINSIDKKSNRRRKRCFDVCLSIFFFVFSPVLCPFVRHRRLFFHNIMYCFSGRKTWVGYYSTTDDFQNKLPKLKKGVLSPVDSFNLEQLNAETIQQINNLYARDYKIKNDLMIVWKGFRKFQHR